MPLYTYYKLCSWEWLSKDLSGITYERLRLSWIAFQKLINYGRPQSDNFSCVKCGKTPDVVVCDGITLSFEKRFATSLVATETGGEAQMALTGLRYHECFLISNIHPNILGL